MAFERARARYFWRAVLPCALASVGAFTASAVLAQSDSTPVIFTFSTVGDNRQDPVKYDPTTIVYNPSSTTQGGEYSPSGTGILPQDQIFLQNSAAWSEIQAGINGQGAQLLFFNGDMIYGYGRPILPPVWTGSPINWSTAITSTYLSTGYTSGGATYNKIYPDAFYEYYLYAYWRGTVSTLFNNGTYVIPVPGNHETQCSYKATPYTASPFNPNCSSSIDGGKVAYAENENAFRANMSDLIQDLVGNLRFSNISGVFATSVTGLTGATAIGPTASSTPSGPSVTCTSPGTTSTTCAYSLSTTSTNTTANNGPVTDTQQYLDYSFDVVLANSGGSPILMHFAIINTDPAGSDQTPPADWLAGDFLAASNRASAGNYSVLYFVFGHKPAFTYNYVGNSPPVAADGLDGGAENLGTTASLTYRNQFWSTIAQYSATYFCGHEHVPNVQTFSDPTGVSTNTPYQVLVGSGGSPFDNAMTTAQDETNPPTEPPEGSGPYNTDRYYAWATVQVHQDGNVTLHLSGFPDTAIGGAVHDMTNYDVPGPVLGNGYLQTASTPAEQKAIQKKVKAAIAAK